MVAARPPGPLPAGQGARPARAGGDDPSRGRGAVPYRPGTVRRRQGLARRGVAELRVTAGLLLLALTAVRRAWGARRPRGLSWGAAAWVVVLGGSLAVAALLASGNVPAAPARLVAAGPLPVVTATPAPFAPAPFVPAPPFATATAPAAPATAGGDPAAPLALTAVAGAPFAPPAPPAPSPTPTPPPVGLPTRLAIPRIGIDAAVDQVGQTPEGAMDVPRGYDTTGWYRLGPRPGQSGNAVITGHVDSPTAAAVFWKLHYLRPGDAITVGADDGERRSFVVTRVVSYRREELPLDEIFGPAAGAQLNLITCDRRGPFDKARQEYGRLVVVYTVAAP